VSQGRQWNLDHGCRPEKHNRNRTKASKYPHKIISEHNFDPKKGQRRVWQRVEVCVASFGHETLGSDRF